MASLFRKTRFLYEKRHWRGIRGSTFTYASETKLRLSLAVSGGRHPGGN